MPVRPHEHVCQVLDSRDDLLHALGDFLDGLQDREGIFVHGLQEDEAWALLEEAGLAADLRQGQRLFVVGHEAAFCGASPRIHHDHAAETVQGALEAAQARGRGLSIIVDASCHYLRAGRADEWFEFETWLGRRLPLEVALNCLYWEQDLQDPRHLELMMKAHMTRLVPA